MLALGDIGQIVRRDDADGGQRPATNVAGNPPDAFAANMAALAAILRDAGARLLFVNPLYRDLDANDAADPAAPGTNLAFRAVWEHRRIVENLAKRLGEGLVDLRGNIPYPATRAAFPTNAYLDPVHFSPAGADRAAALVAEAIMAQNLLAPNPQIASGGSEVTRG
jgi:lysophospholipase L1-like esterase